MGKMRIVQLLTIVLTALALEPGGAHFFERPAKLGLDQQQYFTVQSIYRGWALFGIVLVGTVLANLALAVLSREQRGPLLWADAALLLVVATLAICFIRTFPTNQATQNWTMVPENWQALRERWETSHTVNAVLTFLALCCAVLAGLTWSE